MFRADPQAGSAKGDEASIERVGLICFPECFIPGYRGFGRSAPPPDSAFLERAWSAMAAAAAKANFERVLTAGNTCPLCGAFRGVQTIDAVDDTHLRLNLKQPIAPLLGLMTEVTFGFLSPNSIAKGTDAFVGAA